MPTLRYILPVLLSVLPTSGAGKVVLLPRSSLWLEGSSNLHPFTCHAPTVQLDSEAVRNGEAVTLVRLDVAVPVEQIGCGHREMDERMWKALKAAAFPAITFQLESYEPGRLDLSAQRAQVRVTGRLSIAGVARHVAFDLLLERDGDAIRARGTVPVLLSEYSIAPPVALGGLLTTHDLIHVKFDMSTTFASAQ